jgi:DNA modification methylase
MKRQFIGFDISEEYCKIAVVRIEDTLDLEKLEAKSRKSNNQKEELKSKVKKVGIKDGMIVGNLSCTRLN